jgi:hypothetical protein
MKPLQIELTPMKLIEINPLDVQRVFPSFYHQDSQFFMITYKDHEVGIYGIKTLDPNVCEISLCIFEDYRFKLPYRTGLKLLLDFPFTHKFDKILMSTCEKSIITLLRQCHSLGVEFVGYDKDNYQKVWFKRERQSI